MKGRKNTVGRQRRWDRHAVANRIPAFWSSEASRDSDRHAVANRIPAFWSSEASRDSDRHAVANRIPAFWSSEASRDSDRHAVANRIPAFWSSEASRDSHLSHKRFSKNKAPCDRTDMFVLNKLPIEQRSGLWRTRLQCASFNTQITEKHITKITKYRKSQYARTT